ncbi:pyridoxal phosphate enzyme (YggS family) [Natronospira proteinivora]|uniref:Pyridoxal phosphate homeostasis protein n=1 Tax=Natronospira proteinivora TaxID=1807133 RepID=A0ABT1GAR7_9GAMM|nr:YggS family pyridoxal phosphate-dependent enzyme [Natronospira proteinivora]MCP1728394.1 pyridoxal phosphate enzyme (YggS family) [Natronospira proteinivora]
MKPEMPSSLASQRLTSVRRRIRDAARQAGRDPEAIRLLAVSKTKPMADIQSLAEAGQQDFGENYLQEALDKMEGLAETEPPLCWHFIGPIQSNKTRPIATHFDWVHSVDRFKIARRLSEQRPDHLPPLALCLQVNISEESQKAGVAPDQAAELADAVAELPKVQLRGLMCLPAPEEEERAQRQPFRKLAALMADLNAGGHSLDTLSMGMSADLEAAVLEGSTLIRVGTALFGSRD